MNVMKNIIIIILLQFFVLTVYSQATDNTIVYSYDNAGNRIKREILLVVENRIASVKTDTTKSNLSKPKQEIINDKIAGFDITIYPNPTEGRLSLNVSNLPQSNDNAVKVYDLFGKQLYNELIGSETTELDLSMQPAGSYIMRVIIADKTAVWKIIKK